MHLWLKCPITQPLFCPIFSNFHILYSVLCTIHRYITQIMHLSKKYRKTHLNSCNFTGGNTLITIISVVRLCMHLWLKRPITQPLFCPIFSNFHITVLYVLSIDIHYSYYALGSKVLKNALKLMQLLMWLGAHGKVFERFYLCLHAKMDANIIDL